MSEEYIISSAILPVGNHVKLILGQDDTVLIAADVEICHARTGAAQGNTGRLKRQSLFL
ncbi:hypothetical protein N9E48_08690 [Paracoccaceae bacterium]|nr:hypothetical protein [Paracoccaceae bacterium]